MAAAAEAAAAEMAAAQQAQAMQAPVPDGSAEAASTGPPTAVYVLQATGQQLKYLRSHQLRQ